MRGGKDAGTDKENKYEECRKEEKKGKKDIWEYKDNL